MTEDPNVVTNAEGETVVLEPGDEGYVEPGTEAPEAREGEPVADLREGELPPQDLTLVNEPGQSESEAILAARGTVVESGNPADIVPNTAQIRMGSQEVVVDDPPAGDPEGGTAGLATVEVTDEANVQQDAAAEHQSAADLIAEAEAAQTTAELDRIEGQAEGRVTVLDAVEKRRAEL